MKHSRIPLEISETRNEVRRPDSITVTPTTTPNSPFYGWVVVAASIVIAMMGFGIQNSFGVFFKAFQDDFGWSRTVTAGVFTTYQLSESVLGLVSGWMTDRYGPRRAVLAGGLAIGTGLILASRVEAPWQLYLVYGLFLGFGVSVAWVPLMATVSRWFSRRRGLALGLVGSGVGLGTIVVPLLAGYLISTADWRTAYLVIGIAGMTLILTTSRFLRRDPREQGALPYGENLASEATVTVPIHGPTLIEAVRSRVMWLLFFTFMMVCVGTFMIMTHVVRYAQDTGVSPVLAAGILSAIGAGNIIGKTTMGTVSDRIGIRKALVICMVGQGLAIIGLTGVTSAIGFYSVAVFFGFCFGGWVPLFPALTSAIFGVRHMGLVFSFATIGSGLGSAFGPIFAGYVYDTTQSYLIAFLLGAALSILAAALLPLLKPAANQPERTGS